MIIEVCGAGFKNKGAELMLYAIVQQVLNWNENNIVAANLRTGSFSSRARVGLYHKVWINSYRMPIFRDVLYYGSKFIPKWIRTNQKLIIDDEVDVIFDASGFAYSDQWGNFSLTNLRNDIKRWKMKGKKVILLPQAFGPFTRPELRSLMREVILYADLIYARDIKSFEHLKELDDISENIRVSPDFTNVVKGKLPENSNIYIGRPCIIPNIRMIDKTSNDISKKYIEFLINTINYIRRSNLDPFILIHETDDVSIAGELQWQLEQPITVVKGLNSLYLKGLIGQCLFVVGSRYHGLISALSQGIPCIGTGWSHKYEMLFRDYKCSSYLVRSFNDMSEYYIMLDELINDGRRAEISLVLKVMGISQKEMIGKMWSEVYKNIYE